ncbi:MAG: hypothetical protein IJ011_06490 [Clostridia bacterium]|nr:hypothetical protein [Clostridia bacterium]
MNEEFKREHRKTSRPRKLRDFSAWIAECDGVFSQKLCEIAENVSKDDSVKLLRLIGPTCSGKTTAANMLKERFLMYGKHLHIVSIDDFYLDTEVLRELSRKNGKENVDYDSPDTIDVEALGEFVASIFANDKSYCPVFDFNIGKRSGTREFNCGKEDLFLFEGIQVLYPSVSEIFKNTGHPSVEIYIAPQSAIEIGGNIFEPNEIRLMRRIVRDRNFRRTEADFTFHLWSSVRENEEKNIFPYIGECKYSIDSTMPYEIGILKPYLKSALDALSAESEYRAEADRLLAKIDRVLPLSASLIPEGSLYKEFV